MDFAMKNYEYIVWKEGKYYVSRCINVNVTSFGDSIDEAISNLREAVELYFEDENEELIQIEQVIIGRDAVYV